MSIEKSNNRANGQNPVKPNILRFIKFCLFGAIGGVISTIVLLTVFSLAFLLIKNIPQQAVEPVVILIVVLGSFVCGYVTSRFYKKNGIVCGIVSALIYFIAIFITGYIVINEIVSTFLLIRCLLSVISGIIGGIIGVNKVSKK